MENLSESTPSLVGASVRSVADARDLDVDVLSSRSPSRSNIKTQQPEDKDYTTLNELVDEGALIGEAESYEMLLDASGKVKPKAHAYLNQGPSKKGISSPTKPSGRSKELTVDDLEDLDDDNSVTPEAFVSVHHSSDVSASKNLDFSFTDVKPSDSNIYSLKDNKEDGMSLEDLIDSQLASMAELSSNLKEKISSKKLNNRESRSKTRRQSNGGIIPDSVIENDSLQQVPAGAPEGVYSPLIQSRSQSLIRPGNNSQTSSPEKPHLARGESYSGVNDFRIGRPTDRFNPLNVSISPSREYLRSISRSRTKGEPVIKSEVIDNEELAEEGALINDAQHDRELDDARDSVIDNYNEVLNEQDEIEEEQKREISVERKHNENDADVSVPVVKESHDDATEEHNNGKSFTLKDDSNIQKSSLKTKQLAEIESEPTDSEEQSNNQGASASSSDSKPLTDQPEFAEKEGETIGLLDKHEDGTVSSTGISKLDDKFIKEKEDSEGNVKETFDVSGLVAEVKLEDDESTKSKEEAQGELASTPNEHNDDLVIHGLATEVSSQKDGPIKNKDQDFGHVLSDNITDDSESEVEASRLGEEFLIVQHQTSASEVKKVSEPAEDSVKSKEGTVDIEEDASESKQDTVKTDKDITEPDEKIIGSHEESTESLEKSIEPGQEIIGSHEESTESLEESTEPLEKSTEPLEKSTEPLEKSTEPLEKSTLSEEDSPVKDTNPLITERSELKDDHFVTEEQKSDTSATEAEISPEEDTVSKFGASNNEEKEIELEQADSRVTEDNVESSDELKKHTNVEKENLPNSGEELVNNGDDDNGKLEQHSLNPEEKSVPHGKEILKSVDGSDVEREETPVDLSKDNVKTVLHEKAANEYSTGQESEAKEEQETIAIDDVEDKGLEDRSSDKNISEPQNVAEKGSDEASSTKSSLGERDDLVRESSEVQEKVIETEQPSMAHVGKPVKIETTGAEVEAEVAVNISTDDDPSSKAADITTTPAKSEEAESQEAVPEPQKLDNEEDETSAVDKCVTASPGESASIAEEVEESLHEPTKKEIIELLKDEPVYIYTSLAGGGFMMPSRTNMLATILTANRVPFTYRDLGTDEEARNTWRRYSRGRMLPGVVRGKDDIVGNWEEIQEANEDYAVRTLIYETL